MKRLQFRHHNEIFNDRQSALDFFTNILNPYHVDNEKFGNSLFAEPMVVKYKDNEGNVQVIFALGVDSPNTPYHLIDSKDILERIKVNGDKITNEEARAKAAEAILDEKINNEQNRAEETVKNESNRAIAAENLLSERINTEESLRITGDNEIRTFIGEENSRVINIIIQEVTNRSNEITRVEGILNQEIINRKTADAEVVEVAKIEAKNVAAEKVVEIVDGADSSYDTLKEIADWILNDTTGAAQMANDITTLKANVSTLNGNKDIAGSVKNSVVNGINDAMIINGPTVNIVTPEDAAKVGSLLRKVIISNNNDTQYYVSNKASEMLYVPPATDIPINLNDYITGLENKVIKLEERIAYIEENGTTGGGSSVSPEEVKKIISEYLAGVENEIKVEPNTDNSKLTIGFADDAIFG